MMILVTGASGQLGYEVVKCLNSLHIENLGIGRSECDLTEAEQTTDIICSYRPDAVIHCAAYTAVDRAESEIELCRKVNVDGTSNVAQACKAIGAKMMYISSDYVFSGKGNKAFEVNSPNAPLNAYGKSKADGEAAVKEVLNSFFIVRTSWVFGNNGNNFVKTMLKLGSERKSIDVVCDQIGSPTYAQDLAVLLCDIIQSEKYGTYHATNEGYCSWAEFAQFIIDTAELNCEICPIPTAHYQTLAKRPLNSRLSKSSLDQAGFNRLRDWKAAVSHFISSSF